MFNKNDIKMIYEGYLNQAGNAIDQQNDYQKMKLRPDIGKSNYNQFTGLNSSLKVNAGSIPNFNGGISDEEIEGSEDMIEVKGFGVMTVSQLKSSIIRKSNEISESIANGNMNVSNKADLLKLFADTYQSKNTY